MDIREKLVELLLAVDYICKSGECVDCAVGNCFIHRAADHLICNGVTVQEWIPVTERLPEDFVSVLGCISDAEPFPQVRECYATNEGFYFPALRGIYPVSHWCKMPQPPEGE